MLNISAIKHVPLSEIWKHEEIDFTPWLCRNIDKLSKEIGVNIFNPLNEVSTENFYVDIVAQTGTKNQKVIIENQYGASNHDHLGKLISYTASFRTKYAIWIVEKARIEHIKAIKELNKLSELSGKEDATGFFLIELSVWKIGNSDPGLSFNVVASPSVKLSGKSSSTLLIYDFWQRFLDKCKEYNFDLYKNISASDSRWLNAGSGKKDIYYSVFLKQSSVRVMLCIDKQKDKEYNEAVFNRLFERKSEIEEVIGAELDWNWGKSTDKNNRIIAKEINIGGYASKKNEWNAIITETVKMVEGFEKAFKPQIKNL